jgi:excisionase family DNA binding protein
METSHAPAEHFWTARDLAAVLRVAVGSIYNWVSQGRLPAQRVNGCLRFDPADVRTWLERQRWSTPLLPFERTDDPRASAEWHTRRRVVLLNPGRDERRK